MLRTRIFQEIGEDPNLDQKIIEMNKILVSEPENIKVLEELGAIYYYQRKGEVAAEIYEKLAKIEPQNSNIKAFLGYIYYEMEESEKAIKVLNESLDLNPKEPFVYFVLGNTYSRAGKIKEAVDCYDLAIFLDLDILYIIY